jgi:hypothetical protein
MDNGGQAPFSRKRQMEMFQWLFRQNGFKVSPTGYFVYCNGKNRPGGLQFQARIRHFGTTNKGNPDWVEPTLVNARKCLDPKKIPKPGLDCDFCRYVEAVEEVST